MRKVAIFILCILSIFSICGFASNEGILEQFEDEIYTAYETYEVKEVIENEDYSFMLVRGICNKEGAFGILFENVIDNKYALTINTSQNNYVLHDEGGNYFILAMRLDYVYTINIVLKKDNTLIKSFNINPISADYTDITKGNNQGCEFTKLHKSSDFIENLGLNLYVMIVTIIGVIAFYIVLKIGREYTYTIDRFGNIIQFHKGKKVAVIRSKVRVVAPASHNASIDSEYDEIVSSYHNDELRKEEEKPEIKKREIDEDEIKSTNNAYVKDLISQKGFMTIYNVLSDEEKNNIMVELMMLKNNNEISDKEYDYEVVELWKK